MPTLYYDERAHPANAEETGLEPIPFRVETVHNKPLSDTESACLDSLIKRGYISKPEERAPYPIDVIFAGTSGQMGVAMIDMVNIKAMMADFGIERPEQLTGKTVDVYFAKASGKMVAFSRPE